MAVPRKIWHLIQVSYNESTMNANGNPFLAKRKRPFTIHEAEDWPKTILQLPILKARNPFNQKHPLRSVHRNNDSSDNGVTAIYNKGRKGSIRGPARATERQISWLSQHVSFLFHTLPNFQSMGDRIFIPSIPMPPGNLLNTLQSRFGRIRSCPILGNPFPLRAVPIRMTHAFGSRRVIVRMRI